MSVEKEILSKVSDFIVRNSLLDKGSKYLVAFSGGADSTALALMLRSLGYDIEAVHCNFKLRGEESDRDERFCADLCEANGIELHRVHFDTKIYAQLHKVSIEMAARELRYAYFRQLMRDINASGICVAHHRDDSVETLLMNLIRGTGINGLTGISPVNDRIIRPLLCISRSDIEMYLNAIKQEYMTDSTNLVNDVIRNKIRLDIIPMLQEINPAASINMARTAERITEAVKVFEEAIKKSVEEATRKEGEALYINVDALKRQASPEYTLYSILKEYSFSPSEIENIFANIDAYPGTEYRNATHQLLIDRNAIIVEPLDEMAEKDMRFPEEGVYIYNSMKFRIERIHRANEYIIPRLKSVCAIDAGKLKFPLTVRKAKTGDRFIPFGMKGSKLLSDYMTDRKMSLFDKRRQLVLTDAEDRIIWVVNERSDNRFRISGDTSDIIQITVSVDISDIQVKVQACATSRDIVNGGS